MMNVMNYQDYDVILHVFEAIEKKKFEEAQEYLDSNFSTMILRERVSGDEFLDVYKRIKEGMPDAKFRIVNLSSDGEVFRAKIKITGTHKESIPSLKKGWKVMKPTGRKVNKIITSLEIRLRGDKILEIRNLDAKKGVISGLLDELHLLPRNYSVN